MFHIFPLFFAVEIAFLLNEHAFGWVVGVTLDPFVCIMWNLIYLDEKVLKKPRFSSFAVFFIILYCFQVEFINLSCLVIL